MSFLKRLFTSMPAPLSPVEKQILQTIQQGHALTVRWDCGGDECFVYTELDGVEQRANYSNEQDFPMLLDRYLTDLLELPGAGEFSMEGGGRIFQEGQAILLDYQSQAFADASWMDDMSDEQLADMGYTRPNPAVADDSEEAGYPPDPDMSEQYSGQRVLFTLP